jgi:SAM-dependent methyltransferase
MKRSIKRLFPRRYPIYCPICDTRYADFLPFGKPQRAGVLCPGCFGLERHRLLWLFLHQRTDFELQPLTVLHVAPEPDFGARLRQAERVRYFSVDLSSHRRPSVVSDLTAVGFRSEAFDVIICSHVFEHIPDDRAAMRECHRILRSGGWLSVQVPMRDSATDEDLSITDPLVREKRFGQDDHVRWYGPDIVIRLEEAGFQVTSFSFADVLTVVGDRDIRVSSSEPPILLCRRP